MVLVTGLKPLTRERRATNDDLPVRRQEAEPWHALIMSLSASVLIAAGFVLGGASSLRQNILRERGRPALCWYWLACSYLTPSERSL